MFLIKPTKIPKCFLGKPTKIPKLLADAEVGEDFAQDVVGGDFAGDLAQIVHALANVLAHKVAAQTRAKSVDAALNGIAGT